jgi:protein-disulfide isomerase
VEHHPYGRTAFRALVAGALMAGLGAASAAHAADADVGKQVIDYYRRKANLPPEIDAKVTGITDSKIPGAKSATLELSRGGQVEKLEFLMSPDGRYVVFADVEDVTSDPFAEIAKKIKIDGSPVRGAKDAKVTIVEYSDFQCPYCARAHDTIANQVMPQYEGKVRLVYKNFPLGFHKWAEPAGIAGLCAFEQDPDSFWKLYDHFFKAQRELTPENIREHSMTQLEGTKVNKDKWADCYDNKKTVDKVRADMAEGQQVGVTGTPAFLINGRKLSGAQPFDRFKAIIDDELARAGKN